MKVPQLRGDAKSCLSPVREGSSSAVWATGLLLRAALALRTRPGSSRAGTTRGREHLVSLISQMTWGIRAIGGNAYRRALGQTRGPEHLAVSRSMLGSESCLWGKEVDLCPPEDCPDLLNRLRGVAPILPGRPCLWTTCPRQDSICPAYEPPLTRGVLSVPKRGGDEPSYKECVTWDCLGYW